MEKQRNMTSIFLCTENKILLLFRQGSKVVNNMWIGSAGGHFEEYELNVQPMTLPRPSISTLSKPSFSISALMHMTTSFSSQLSLGWEIISRRKRAMSAL